MPELSQRELEEALMRLAPEARDALLVLVDNWEAVEVIVGKKAADQDTLLALAGSTRQKGAHVLTMLLLYRLAALDGTAGLNCIKVP